MEAFTQLLMPTTPNIRVKKASCAMLLRSSTSGGGIVAGGVTSPSVMADEMAMSSTGFSYSEVKPAGQAGSFACISKNLLGCFGMSWRCAALPLRKKTKQYETITMVVAMAEAVVPARAMEVWRQLHICSSAQGTQGNAGGWGGQVNHQRPNDLK